MITVEPLLAAWRSDAQRLRAWGGSEVATALERCADELEAQTQAWEFTPLTLIEAAQESGYSAGHLRRLIRRGTLRDEGTNGMVQVRRGTLPRKAGSHHPLGLLSPI